MKTLIAVLLGSLLLGACSSKNEDGSYKNAADMGSFGGLRTGGDTVVGQ